MPFSKLLKELVKTVAGATGAIFMDAEGEAVQWHATSDAARLRLRAAYLAVAFKTGKAAARALGQAEASHLLLRYENASFVVKEVESGYFVALELDASANLGQALYRLDPIVAGLRRVLTS